METNFSRKNIPMVSLGENPVPSNWTSVAVPDPWYHRYFWDFIFTWLQRTSGPQHLSDQAFLASLSHDQRAWMQANIHHGYVFDKQTACLWFQDAREAMLFRLTFC
jgi:hypothetical protein